jgi:hypothetical protein
MPDRRYAIDGDSIRESDAISYQCAIWRCPICNDVDDGSLTTHLQEHYAAALAERDQARRWSARWRLEARQLWAVTPASIRKWRKRKSDERRRKRRAAREAESG